MTLFWLLLAGLTAYAFWSGILRKPARHEALGGGFALMAMMFTSRGSLLLAAASAAAAVAIYLAGDAKARAARDAEAKALATLELEPGASAEAVRAAHRRLSAVAHPDRGGTHEAQQALNAARDLLLRRAEGAMR